MKCSFSGVVVRRPDWYITPIRACSTPIVPAATLARYQPSRPKQKGWNRAEHVDDLGPFVTTDAARLMP